MKIKHKISIIFAIIFLMTITYVAGVMESQAKSVERITEKMYNYDQRVSEIYLIETLEQAESQLNLVKSAYNLINEEEQGYFYNKRSLKWNENRLEIFLKRHFRGIRVHSLSTINLAFFNYNKDGSRSGKIILETNTTQTNANIYDIVDDDNCKNPVEVKKLFDDLLVDSDTDAREGNFYISLFDEPNMKIQDAYDFEKYPLGKYNRTFFITRKLPNVNNDQSLTIATSIKEKDVISAFQPLYSEGGEDINELKNIVGFLILNLMLIGGCAAVILIFGIFAIKDLEEKCSKRKG